MNVFADYEWDFIESLNEELCSKAGYQHGRTSDGYEGAKAFFEEMIARESCSLPEAVDLLRQMHRKAPFLFLNGNTFCEVGRELLLEYGSNTVKTRAQIFSIVGHHIAGKQLMDLEELKALLSA